MKKLFLVILLIPLLLPASLKAAAYDIFLFEDASYTNVNRLADHMTQLGYKFDRRTNPAQGDTAAALAQNTYNQLWIFEGTTLRLNSADLDAIKTFYLSHPNIIFDGRAYAISYGHTTTAELAADKAFVQNAVTRFREFGGGLYFATDHATSFCQNSNAILTKLAYKNITGAIAASADGGRLDAELLNSPNKIVLEDFDWDAGSCGIGPFGVQSDGIDLKGILWNKSDGNWWLVSNMVGPCPDLDTDTVCDGLDNCRDRANTNQSDKDLDGVGDACDCAPTDPNEPGLDGKCPTPCAGAVSALVETSQPARGFGLAWAFLLLPLGLVGIWLRRR
jgi:hypothetical protein